MDNFNLKKFLGEKSLLNESAPGYDTRKFGEALPTLESVKAAYEAKECKCGKGETCKCNLEEEKGEKIVPSQPSDERVIDIIKKMAPKTKTKFLKKLAKLKDNELVMGDDDEADDDAMASIMMDAPDRY